MRLKKILPLAPLALLQLAACHEGKTPPPWGTPITGGTMIVTRTGSHAVIADPDRDRILTVDLATRTVTAEVALTPGDQPGRLIEDGSGRIHVSLRGGGALLTLAGVGGEITARRWACAEPRGLAWDAATDNVHVACASGELVTFAAAGGDALRGIKLERDLRDVIVQGDHLVVTKFRSAEVLTLDAQGTILSRVVPPTVQRFSFKGGGFPEQAPDTTGGGGSSGLVDAIPAVAWRTIALPDGRLVITHQRQIQDKLDSRQEGGYGTGCGGPVEAAVTVVTPGQAPVAIQPIASGALPVDIATTRTGDKLALLTAGNRNVRIVPTTSVIASQDMNDCRPPDFPDDPRDDDGDGNPDNPDDPDGDDAGAPTSLAFTPTGDLIVYFPEKPMIEIHRGGSPLATESIELTGSRGFDAGRSVFHAQTALGIACASCHPEGREDGLTWDFAEFGKRRTQNLAGHILERAPYHWSGDMSSLPVLMDDVFAVRMAGGALTERQKRSLGPWLDKIQPPAPSAIADVTAIDRGKEIFASAETGCVSCHNGDLFSNKLLVDVGTGGKFKVPSLVGIGARAPFMHDGCAKTLMDRFTVCGNSPLHGATAQLSQAELGDLVAYLESL